MVTDDERRRVAEMLRSLAGGYVTIGEMEDALGICMSSPIIDLERDARDLHRLADLIEPSIPADPGEAGLACVDAFIREHTEKPVDRDALLALADEIHWLVENQEIRFFHVVQVHEFTLATIERRIRKALGVTDG